MLYEDPDDLDARTRSRLESLLMAGERFVLAARCDDAVLDRWATRVVVTTDRVLAVRHVLLEWTVEGARHDWIGAVQRIGGSTVRVERKVDTEVFTFPDAETADAVVEAVETQGAARAVATASP